MNVPKSSQHRRSPEHKRPQIVFIDFDRTLGDVDMAMKRFNYVLGFNLTSEQKKKLSKEQRRFHSLILSHGVDADQINKERKYVEDDGGSFDPLGYITKKLPEAALKELCSRFIEEKKFNLLYDDALPFLDMLRNNDIPYHILTYGKNPLWQKLKVAASGYQNGFSVMDNPNKGEEIGTYWDHHREAFLLRTKQGSYVAPSSCLLDDKLIAFTGLPEMCNGFVLQRNAVLLPSQQGTILPQVQIIRSLRELTAKDGRLIRWIDQ